MSGQIKAVVFDMDGVLIDAREWHYEALNRALGLLGYEISRYEHLVDVTTGCRPSASCRCSRSSTACPRSCTRS